MTLVTTNHKYRRGFQMIKTFREILAEKDDEFTYHLHSTANIHRPELFERIKLSFMPYNIKAFETDTYKPLSKTNTMFPEEPYSSTYSIKIVTGFKVPSEHLQTVAMTAHIHIAHLKMEGDQDVELVNKPEEVPSTEAQKLVGSKRISDFINELQTERRQREQDTVEREVYETFYTTHRGLEDVLKKPVRKGYYMVEMRRDDTD